MSPRRRAERPRTEKEIVERAARFLSLQGYRTYVDPDGTDYFDLIGRRGEEVGLVEAKLGRGRALIAQALRRRAWGNWVAVVLPSPGLAGRLLRETTGRRSEPVGVWCAETERVQVLRPAVPFPRGPSEEDPYAPLRAQMHRALDRLDHGEIPEGIRWDGVVREVRRASGGRGFSEWRLDEGP